MTCKLGVTEKLIIIFVGQCLDALMVFLTLVNVPFFFFFGYFDH